MAYIGRCFDGAVVLWRPVVERDHRRLAQNAAPFHVMLVMFLLGGGFLFDRLIAAALVIFGVILAQWPTRPRG